MQKNLGIKLVVSMMALGLVFTVSCAKKSVVSEPASVTIETGDEAASQAAADQQAALDRQAALEEEARLKEEALREDAARKKMAAQRRFGSQDIHFAYDSAELSPMSRMLLKEKAAWMEENSGVSVVIEGHCDERGTTEYNLALGERRARAAEAFMKDLGIASFRLSTISYGEERPLDTVHNEAGWAKNRRAHFMIR